MTHETLHALVPPLREVVVAVTVTPRPRNVVRIASVELRRSARKAQANPTQLALFGFSVLLLVLFSLGLAVGAWSAGRALAGGAEPPFPVVPTARGVVGLVAVSLSGLTMARTAGQAADLDDPDALLSTVPVADAAAGALLAEAGRILLLLGPALAVVGSSFAVAVGAPAMAATLPLTTLGLVLVSYPVGFAVGFGFRYVLTHYPPVAAHRTLIGAVLLVAWMAVALSGTLDDVGRTLFDPLAATPLGWLADLLFLGVPGVSADPVRAAVALAVALLVAAPAMAAAVRVSEVVWLSDPPRSDEGDGDETERGGWSSALEDAWLVPARDVGLFDRPTIRAVTARRTRAVATAVWLRARRAPVELTYVLYPVFFGIAVIQDVFRRGAVPAYVPSTLLLYAAWAVGAAFTLNALGSQGPALPATLTSRIDGRSYLRGHLLVAAVVGAPLATALTVGAAVVSPLGLVEVALLAAVTPLCAVGAAGLAAGLGVLFPRFGSVSVTTNRDAVVPSKSAGVTYSLLLLVVLSLAVAGVEPTARDVVADAVGVGPVVLVAASLVPLAVCSYLSYRYAASSIGEYRLD